MKLTSLAATALALALPFAALTPASAQSSFGSSSANGLPAITTPGTGHNGTGTGTGTTRATVNQGDKLLGGEVTIPGAHFNNASCTAGYVNKSERTVYLAAHCAEDGARIKNTAGQVIGTFHRYSASTYDMTKSWDAQWTTAVQTDFGKVALDSDVAAGSNTYSGDTQISQAGSLPIGTKVCAYGVTTGATRCGEVIKTNPAVGRNVLYTSIATRPGDSGGPVWVPGTGFVGVMSLTWSDHSATVTLR